MGGVMKSNIAEIVFNKDGGVNPASVEILVHTKWTDDWDPIRVAIPVEDENERLLLFDFVCRAVWKNHSIKTLGNDSIIAIEEA
jgi:hypothetical protein